MARDIFAVYDMNDNEVCVMIGTSREIADNFNATPTLVTSQARRMATNEKYRFRKKYRIERIEEEDDECDY